MTQNDGFENDLDKLPVPMVSEDDHRAELKSDLQKAFTVPHGKEVKRMQSWKKVLVYACCLVLVTATAAWAYQTYVAQVVLVEIDDNGFMTTTVTDEDGIKEITSVRKLDLDDQIQVSGGLITINVDEQGIATQSITSSEKLKEMIENGDLVVVTRPGEINESGEMSEFYVYSMTTEDGVTTTFESNQDLFAEVEEDSTE